MFSLFTTTQPQNPMQQIARINPISQENFTTRQIQRLSTGPTLSSASQISSIKGLLPEQVALLTPQQIRQFNPFLLASLTKEQRNNLTPTQIKLFDPNIIALILKDLQPEQLEQLTPEQINRLPQELKAALVPLLQQIEQQSDQKLDSVCLSLGPGAPQSCSDTSISSRHAITGSYPQQLQQSVIPTYMPPPVYQRHGWRRGGRTKKLKKNKKSKKSRKHRNKKTRRNK